jgi:hypothetical protein
MKVYCEHGALTSDLRSLQREGRIELMYFPYDPDSRARAISPTATASEAQYQDLNLRYNELSGAFNQLHGSELLPRVREIVGHEHRRDALHLDSAYKSGCGVFVTRDSDILKHRSHLEGLLGFSIINPDQDHALLVKLLPKERCRGTL